MGVNLRSGDQVDPRIALPVIQAHARTIPELFCQTVTRFPDGVALRHKDLGRWRQLSWADYRDRVEQVAYGVVAMGLNPGDRVAIAGENCPEWLWADLGVQCAGGVPVGIYTTSAAEQCEYVVNHSEARLLFVENEEQLDKWLVYRAKTPRLERVIVWDDTGLRDFSDPAVISLDELLEKGRAGRTRAPDEFDKMVKTVKSTDVSMIVYTSGTTGPPKGAVLTHANTVWMGHTMSELDPDVQISEDDEVMSFLPLCHIFERIFSLFVPLTTGCIVNFVESPETVEENMREISPTVAYGVPRMWEKYKSTVEIRMDDADWFNRRVFGWAISIGRKEAAARLAGEDVSASMRLLTWMADWAVFRPLRHRLGMDRARLAFSGAAPIAPEVLTFFHAIGVRLVEGYGQTEAAGVISGTGHREFRPGYVGKALAGVDVRLSDDGEIMVRSAGVFAGYFKDPVGTSGALIDGWLATGDIGEIDDGYLRIVDRKKDLIITAGGKNVAPQFIENKLKASAYVTDAVVIGDRRKFLCALIVLDEDNVVKYAQDHKVSYSTYSELAVDDTVERLIQQVVNETNHQVSRVESIRKFRILPKRLYQEDGEVTPTMKVKRAFIHEAYAELIEEMYRG